MKKKIKIIELIFLAIIILLIPLIINILFKYDFNIWWLQSEWSAGDALSFFGCIMSAIIGIIGVYITVEIAKKNYRDDLRNQALPIFSINYLTKQYAPFNLFEIDDIPEEESNEVEQGYTEDYKEFRLRKAYFILTSDKISIALNLSKTQMDLIKHNGELKMRGNLGEIIMSRTNLFSQAIELENVGKGAAINVRIGINRAETKDADKNLLIPVNLKPNEFFYINVFSEDISDNVFGKYILEINYSDIYNNIYFQEYEFEIEFKNIDGQDGYMVNFDYNTVQKKLNKF